MTRKKTRTVTLFSVKKQVKRKKGGKRRRTKEIVSLKWSSR